jgi:hypothetical protein
MTDFFFHSAHEQKMQELLSPAVVQIFDRWPRASTTPDALTHGVLTECPSWIVLSWQVQHTPPKQPKTDPIGCWGEGNNPLFVAQW